MLRNFSYYKKIKGLTSYTNGFNNPVADLSEGESTILGVDILLKKKIENYRIWAGYTFNDIDYTFPQIQSQPFLKNNDITHNFRISNAYRFNNYKFSLGWMFRTGEPYTPIKTFDESSTIVEFGNINSDILKTTPFSVLFPALLKHTETSSA